MSRSRLLLRALFCCLPLLYLGWVWNDLPDIVPTHFDLTGKPDDYSSKGALWAITGFMIALSMGMYLLFTNLHRIDPKRYGTKSVPSFERLADGMVLFLTVLNFVIVLACSGYEAIMGRLIFPLIGLLFAFLGNVMFSLKPNYFAGIRVPWTLADDGNWRATHRIAGIVWFAGGILLAAGSFLIRREHTELLLFAILIPMIVIPVVYSYLYFRRSVANKN